MNYHTFDWRNYLPLAKAAAGEFYKNQERGKFDYLELLSVSVEALITSPGVTYAKKAIKGALNDYVRETYKLVRNIEISEEEYLRTRGNPILPRAAVRRVFVSEGVRHTLYTPAAYRSNAQLLSGDGKVGRHGKVSVAIGRTTYDDGWSQTSSGWKRGKIDDDENHDCAPSTRIAQPSGGINQADYVGGRREQRWSVHFLNAGDDVLEKSGQGDDKVVVSQNGRPFVRKLAKGNGRRFFVPPTPDVGISGRTSRVIVDLKKLGLEPVPADKLGRWRDKLATEPRLRVGSSLIAWQREAGYFEVLWGLPDITILWNFVKENGRWYRREGIFSPQLEEVLERADVISRDDLKQEFPCPTRFGRLGSAGPLSFYP